MWCKEEEREDIYTQSLLEDDKAIDGKEGENVLSIENLARRESLKVELANRLQMEEISWRQKLRARWIKQRVKILSTSTVWQITIGGSNMWRRWILKVGSCKAMRD